ncbi:cation-transporting P-type ATPase [Candidatus Saccharibacteria bacterium]|nr:cation-transporting P-type ATPase [Candidatus Saccharibacteria bacterium]
MVVGLTFEEVKKLRLEYGFNVLHDEQTKNRTLVAFLARFKNPLVIILIVAAGMSLFFGDKASFFIITAIVFLSVGLDFLNTYRSGKAAEALKEKVRVKARVIREGKEHLVAVKDLVPGDVVMLSSGKVIPADGVIIEGNDLSANEAALTGESFPQSKIVGAEVYMGSGVESGAGIMKVIKTGSDTKFAHIAKTLQSARRETEFDVVLN